jgi:hypothetical protein
MQLKEKPRRKKANAPADPTSALSALDVMLGAGHAAPASAPTANTVLHHAPSHLPTQAAHDFAAACDPCDIDDSYDAAAAAAHDCHQHWDGSEHPDIQDVDISSVDIQTMLEEDQAHQRVIACMMHDASRPSRIASAKATANAKAKAKASAKGKVKATPKPKAIVIIHRPFQSTDGNEGYFYDTEPDEHQSNWVGRITEFPSTCPNQRSVQCRHHSGLPSAARHMLRCESLIR